MRKEIVMSGTGGQGVILAGLILAEAAVADGLNATHNQSYGPEARGGASRSEVILSTEDIDYAEIDNPDILVALSQEACSKYAKTVRPGGVLVIDPYWVNTVDAPAINVVKIPVTETAFSNFQKDVAANIIALAALVAMLGLVSEDAAREAVLLRVPPSTREMNSKALEAGFALGKAVKQ